MGVDIERIRTDLASADIAARFYSPDERATLRLLETHQRTEAFFNCWTRKEAFIKALGEGLSHPLDRFSVSLAPGEPASLLSTDDPRGPAGWSLSALSPGPGYAGALAVEGEVHAIHCWQWEGLSRPISWRDTSAPSRPAVVRLLRITPAVVESLLDPNAFRRHTGAHLGAVEPLVRDVVAQSEAHRAKTGAAPEWAGFIAIDAASRQVVGTCAFTGAPDADGRVEIAYFTFPAYEGQGYGGSMARELLAEAAASGAVRLVYAFTLPEENASTRILSRCGFTHVGTAVDADAGTVWRWERPLPP